MGRVEHALDVDGDHALPLLGVRTHDRAQEHEARVVDQGVEPADPLDGMAYGRLCLGAVGDVRFHDQRGASRLVDLGSDVFETAPAAGDERDASTELCELAGGRGTDTTARAGDESGRAGQFLWCHRGLPRTGLKASSRANDEDSSRLALVWASRSRAFRSTVSMASAPATKRSGVSSKLARRTIAAASLAGSPPC